MIAGARGRRNKRADTAISDGEVRPSVWMAIAVVALLGTGAAAKAIDQSWSTSDSSLASSAWGDSALNNDVVFEKQPRVAFLGDSYTQGAGTDNGSKAFVMVAARKLRWSGRQFAVGGSGYSGPPGRSYGERLQHVIDFRPDYVVVSGSRNDTRVGPGVVHAEAVTLFQRIREQLPAAQLIVVGPIWVDQSPPTEILRLNSEVRSAAEGADAVFIDALDPSWMDGSAELIADDDIHPTERGHDRLAERFVDEVVAAKIPEPRKPRSPDRLPFNPGN